MDDGVNTTAVAVAERVAAPAPKAEKAPITSGAKIAAIVPRDVDEAWRLTGALIDAGMIPASYEVKDRGSDVVDYKATRARLMIGIMKAMEVGFAPITGLSTIAVINNRPCIWGDGAVSLVQNSGKLEWRREWLTGKEMTEEWTAHVEYKRIGQPQTYTGTFSAKDAKRANLWMNPRRQPWMLYPQRMLMMRARAFALRDGFADVLSGLSIAEEVQDLPEAPKPVDASFLDDDTDDAPKAIAAPAEMGDEPPAEVDEWADLLASMRTEAEGMDYRQWMTFLTDNDARITEMCEARPDLAAAWTAFAQEKSKSFVR